jgi:hypothetical protein
MRVSALAKKRIIYGLAGLLAVLLVALGVFLWKRQQLLNYALVQVKAKVEAKYPVTLTLGPARFMGLKTVEINGMSLVPTAAAGPAAAGDTLLTARRLQACLRAARCSANCRLSAPTSRPIRMRKAAPTFPFC